jgi:hypothetical protein
MTARVLIDLATSSFLGAIIAKLTTPIYHNNIPHPVGSTMFCATTILTGMVITDLIHLSIIEEDKKIAIETPLAAAAGIAEGVVVGKIIHLTGPEMAMLSIFSGLFTVAGVGVRELINFLTDPSHNHSTTTVPDDNHHHVTPSVNEETTVTLIGNSEVLETTEV